MTLSRVSWSAPTNGNEPLDRFSTLDAHSRFIVSVQVSAGIDEEFRGREVGSSFSYLSLATAARLGPEPNWRRDGNDSNAVSRNSLAR
jgi:hypothetical protein